MTDEELVKALRDFADDGYADLSIAAADRIEALTKERERLALAICGGEDAPGFANVQTVETLEKVARDNANDTMTQINRTLAVEAKLAQALEALREIAGECGCSTARAIIAEIEGEKT